MKRPDASDNYVELTSKLASRCHKIVRTTAITAGQVLPEHRGVTTSALLYILVHMAMGVVPVIAMGLQTGKNIRKKAGEGFPGKLTRDDILFACLYIAHTESTTEAGQRTFGFKEERPDAEIDREIDKAHYEIHEAFRKVRGYKYTGTIIPSNREEREIPVEETSHEE